MSERLFKLAIIAGEASGDLLGADLVATLKTVCPPQGLEIVGVGGPALEAEGLKSFFDYSELSIMGLTAVLARLPQLIIRINETARRIIAAKPDALVIIDSPDFTHRVARKVRAALPDLPVIDYVCPSVWAWKEYRARAMTDYVDHVLAVLPFEPAVMARLGGPDTTYIGHRLRYHPALLAARSANRTRWATDTPTDRTLLLLPGSRSHEVRRLLPVFGEAVTRVHGEGLSHRLLLATVPHQEARVREIIETWPVKPELFVGESQKWQAFAMADCALAASGTVLLELALSGIPAISTYRTDFFIRQFMSRIKVWSAALPNLIAGYPVVSEYFDEFIRPELLMRSLGRLSSPTPERQAMLAGFDEVFETMAVPRRPAELGAEIVLSLMRPPSES